MDLEEPDQNLANRPKPFVTRFANRLKQYEDEIGNWSPKRFEIETGIPQTSRRDWDTGHRGVTRQQICCVAIAIARLLDFKLLREFDHKDVVKAEAENAKKLLEGWVSPDDNQLGEVGLTTHEYLRRRFAPKASFRSSGQGQRASGGSRFIDFILADLLQAAGFAPIGDAGWPVERVSSRLANQSAGDRRLTVATFDWGSMSSVDAEREIVPMPSWTIMQRLAALLGVTPEGMRSHRLSGLGDFDRNTSLFDHCDLLAPFLNLPGRNFHIEATPLPGLEVNLNWVVHANTKGKLIEQDEPKLNGKNSDNHREIAESVEILVVEGAISQSLRPVLYPNKGRGHKVAISLAEALKRIEDQPDTPLAFLADSVTAISAERTSDRGLVRVWDEGIRDFPLEVAIGSPKGDPDLKEAIGNAVEVLGRANLIRDALEESFGIEGAGRLFGRKGSKVEGPGEEGGQ